MLQQSRKREPASTTGIGLRRIAETQTFRKSCFWTFQLGPSSHSLNLLQTKKWRTIFEKVAKNFFFINLFLNRDQGYTESSDGQLPFRFEFCCFVFYQSQWESFFKNPSTATPTGYCKSSAKSPKTPSKKQRKFWTANAIFLVVFDYNFTLIILHFSDNDVNWNCSRVNIKLRGGIEKLWRHDIGLELPCPFQK